jgi:hypothetical protein
MLQSCTVAFRKVHSALLKNLSFIGACERLHRTGLILVEAILSGELLCAHVQVLTRDRSVHV